MKTDITIAGLSESVAEGIVGAWLKNVGDEVIAGETVVEIETDKVVLEIPAPVAGVLEKIVKNPNDSVVNNDVIGIISGEAKVAKSINKQSQPENIQQDVVSMPEINAKEVAGGNVKTSPAVRKLMSEHNLSIADIQPSGKKGRIKKTDVLQAINATPQNLVTKTKSQQIKDTERVPMSSLRKRVAARLVAAQQEYAMLTTFNEVNMHNVVSIRTRYKERFQEVHGVKLSYMSFFSLAVTEALQQFPIINASVEDEHIIYHRYIDLGIAVSSERGLVVPVVRNADQKSLVQIEQSINDLTVKARTNSLDLDDLSGGTFTITNGGVFGSMMSTPIINPPQSAILGMHAIQKKPIVDADEIIIRPMMFLALSYDHRIIDGREAVLFLSRIKEIIENPINLLLHL